VGSYLNFAADFLVHGFLRKHDGTFTTFDAPTADSSIIPVGINPAGEITGYYFGADFQDHGFLRRHDGTFITFHVPAATGEGQYTVPTSINPGGEIAGYYVDTNTVTHGFLRAHNGTFTTFDAPGGPGSIPFGSQLSINPEGEIAGSFCDAAGCHGFLRARNGTFTAFDVSTTCCIGTGVSAINPSGVITGGYSNRDFNSSDLFVIHGYVRTPDGTITTFDAPGAGTSLDQGTNPVSINPSGEIMGVVIDSNQTSHGFLLTYKAR
jgi:hypothetical protein